ncbi:ArsR/SmtB family transcription factor [Alkaliphilus oremlandii]|uniref:Transcriptional regulator, TrmB n=1 Tax=Alkaliphilus oremlandii (strain OhILAs) TaxID=350688 RepID=A8MGV8_ALKOO|nr:metalloregulator ArsR/SmtB family transcription factor [Alkaliphilus oremlandii]ABW18652.1 transcriptional regulator, TrmB [Alkaliphilus oremlandii OhILAs]
MDMLLKKEEIASLRLTSKLLKGFADYSRLCIFEVLKDGERTVSEIVEITGMSQSSISNHLKCLRECDLVNDRQEGKYIYYSISNNKVNDIINLAREIIKETSEEKYRCLNY